MVTERLRIDLEGVDLDPRYDLDDPRRSQRMSALLEVLGPPRPLHERTVLVPETGSTKDPPLITVTCFPIGHIHTPDGGAPELAQVHATSEGVLYIASIAGRFRDWFADETQSGISPGLATSERGNLSVPSVLYCVLLKEHGLAVLPVKCREHGHARIDVLRLHQAYLRSQQLRRTGMATPRTHVIRLPDVVADAG